MNARNQLYVSRNSRRAKSICSSKYATKIVMLENNIPTAQVYGVLATIEDVNDFDWSNLSENFVIKPTNGHAGKGVAAFVKKLKNRPQWKDVIGQHWSVEDIKLHCFDILEGQYSTHGSNHKVIIEERIISHPLLMKYSYQGTPDIRVVVFNSVPVMSYMRLPTKESEGRANQSQGALGVGIDLGTGLTTFAAAHKTQLISYLPDTKIPLRDIRIPYWKKALTTAVRAAIAAGLTYCGVDLFIDHEKGPMVVELNYEPGLSIQIANQDGLRRRLQRLEGLKVVDADHGVRIARALFAESVFDEEDDDKLIIVNHREDCEIENSTDKKNRSVTAQIQSGRYRSAVSANLAKELGLLDREDLLWYQKEEGEGQLPVIEATLRLKNKTITSTMLVSKKLDRTPYQIEIGRRDLSGFLIKPDQS